MEAIKKLRIVIEQDGTERLQFSRTKSYGQWYWEDVPKILTSEELVPDTEVEDE